MCTSLFVCLSVSQLLFFEFPENYDCNPPVSPPPFIFLISLLFQLRNRVVQPSMPSSPLASAAFMMPPALWPYIFPSQSNSASSSEVLGASVGSETDANRNSLPFMGEFRIQQIVRRTYPRPRQAGPTAGRTYGRPYLWQAGPTNGLS